MCKNNTSLKKAERKTEERQEYTGNNEKEDLSFLTMKSFISSASYTFISSGSNAKRPNENNFLEKRNGNASGKNVELAKITTVLL